MATTGSIEYIREIVDSYGEEQCKKLNYQWSQDIEDSNLLISQMESDSNYIEKNMDRIIAMMERLNKELDYYAELGIDLETSGPSTYGFPEIRRNLEKNYRTLSLSYYKYIFEKNKIQFQESKKSLDNIVEKQTQIESKMDSVDNRVEGLGATFLNIVLTVSITSTMVTVLLNTNSKYSLAIVLSCAWLLLSSIIFISSYFKSENKKNENSKLALIIYVILSLVTLVSFLFGIFTDCDTNKKNNNSDKVNHSTSIWIE